MSKSEKKNYSSASTVHQSDEESGFKPASVTKKISKAKKFENMSQLSAEVKKGL